jgi:hypothetical protein
MSTRFLPIREAELDAWLANFSTLISATPTRYNLSPGDAAEIAAAVSAWHAAYQTAVAPATRTVTSVLDKNMQKKNVTAIVRRFAAVIRADVTIASADKINLGLVLRDTRPPRVNPPASEPNLSMTKMATGMHFMHATNGGEESLRRPKSAAGLVVFRAVGDTPPSEPSEATYLGHFTRTRFTSSFTAEDRGKFATYFARWVNAKGEPGPWSRGVSVAIAA